MFFLLCALGGFGGLVPVSFPLSLLFPWAFLGSACGLVWECRTTPICMVCVRVEGRLMSDRDHLSRRRGGDQDRSYRLSCLSL